MTRSIENWNDIPGNLDCLNAQMLFPSDNKYGIPDLLADDFIPSDLVPYGTEVRRSYAQTKGKCVHFFLDDYKFEPLWNKPIKTRQPIITVGQALTPDFSLYRDYPIALQIYNTYRNRWLGRYWQQFGVQVIPTVGWSDEKSYDFCFEGVPKNSVVAVGTVGINNKENKKIFCQGFEKMCEILEPKSLIVYGETEPLDFESYIKDVHKFETYWAKRRRVLKNERKEI